MRFFTSDYHIGHNNIIAYSQRPFQNTEEMTREIIARHNAVVGPDDIVYNVGDFALNEKLVQEVLGQLNGTQHLIAGNHDSCHSHRTKHKKSALKYLSYGFASVQEQIELQIGNHEVLVTHMPFLRPDDKDQRYPQFRPTNTGQFLICGHVHEKWKVNGRQINVGVDQWDFTPVSETELSDLMADIIELEQV
jgi:calcineurin-like phosphoesterase family protein